MGIFGGKKAVETKIKDENKLREKQVSIVSAKILQLIVENDLKMGTMQLADEKKYDEVALEIIELMLQNKIKYTDKNFLFQLALQPIDKLKDIVVNSLSRTFDATIDKVLGKEFRDLTLQDMDVLLKSQVTVEKIKGNA